MNIGILLLVSGLFIFYLGTVWYTYKHNRGFEWEYSIDVYFLTGVYFLGFLMFLIGGASFIFTSIMKILYCILNYSESLVLILV